MRGTRRGRGGAAAAALALGVGLGGAPEAHAQTEAVQMTVDRYEGEAFYPRPSPLHVNGQFSLSLRFRPNRYEGLGLDDLAFTGAQGEPRASASNLRAATGGRGALVDVDVETGYEGALTVTLAEDALDGGSPGARLVLDVDQTAPEATLGRGSTAWVNARARTFEVTMDLTEPVAYEDGSSEQGYDTYEVDATDFDVEPGRVWTIRGGPSRYTVVIVAPKDYEGPVTVRVRAGSFSDAVRNFNGAAALSVPVDTQPPQASLEAEPGRAGGAFTAWLEFDETVEGVEASDVEITNGALEAGSFVQDGDARWRARIVPDGPGTITVRVAAGAAHDTAGNPSTAAQLERTVTPEPLKPQITSATTGPTDSPFVVTIDFGEGRGVAVFPDAALAVRTGGVRGAGYAEAPRRTDPQGRRWMSTVWPPPPEWAGYEGGGMHRLRVTLEAGAITAADGATNEAASYEREVHGATVCGGEEGEACVEPIDRDRLCVTLGAIHGGCTGHTEGPFTAPLEVQIWVVRQHITQGVVTGLGLDDISVTNGAAWNLREDERTPGDYRVTVVPEPGYAGPFTIAVREGAAYACESEARVRCDRTRPTLGDALTIEVRAREEGEGPQAPWGLVADGGDGEVTLRWAMGSEGRQARSAGEEPEITGWEVRHGAFDARTGQSAWGRWAEIAGATAETRSHTVRGLANGAHYAFQIRAMAGTTQGAPSAAMIARPEAGARQEAHEHARWLGWGHHTVARQIGSAIAARTRSARAPALRIAGEQIPVEGAHEGKHDAWARSPQVHGARETLRGSGFEAGPDGGLGAWGHVAHEGFGSDQTGRGEATTAVLGADAEHGRWLAGVALARSTIKGAEAGRRARVTTLAPYAKYEVNADLAVWGALGKGVGTLKNEGSDGREERSDTTMTMGVVGARGTLVSERDGAPLTLAVGSETLWQRTEVRGPTQRNAAKRHTRETRATLDASRRYTLEGAGATLVPGVSASVRHASGEEESANALEGGIGLRVEHRRGGAEIALERKGRGQVRWRAVIETPANAGERGLSLRLSPRWDRRAMGESQGAGLEGEVSYGYPAGRARVRPYAAWGLGSANGAEGRAGIEWSIGATSRLAIEVGEGEGGGAVRVHGKLRW